MRRTDLIAKRFGLVSQHRVPSVEAVEKLAELGVTPRKKAKKKITKDQQNVFSPRQTRSQMRKIN